MVQTVSEFIVEMRAQIQRVATSEASVKTLISGMVKQLSALRDELASKGVSPEDLAGLTDTLNTVTAAADDLAADVTSVPPEDTGADTPPAGGGDDTVTGGTGADTVGDAPVGDGSGADTTSGS